MADTVGSEKSIERDLMDAPDSEWLFAGRVVGTKWEFPDGSVQEVQGVQLFEESEMGESFRYPELQFDQGRTIRANSFRRKIHPSRDEYDTTPAEHVSDEIVRWIQNP